MNHGDTKNDYLLQRILYLINADENENIVKGGRQQKSAGSSVI